MFYNRRGGGGGLLFIGGKERAIPTSNRCGIAYFLKTNTIKISSHGKCQRNKIKKKAKGKENQQNKKHILKINNNLLVIFNLKIINFNYIYFFYFFSY